MAWGTLRPSIVRYAPRTRKLSTVAVSGGGRAIAGEEVGWAPGEAL